MPWPIPPDPDFRLADSDAAAALRSTADTLDASAASLKAQERALTATNSGHGVDTAVEQIDHVVRALSRAADAAAAAARLRDACAAARDHFRTVTAGAAVADVQAAFEEWQSRRTKLMAADDHHAALYRRAMAEAQVRYDGLLQRRETAVHNYETAEDAATAAYQAALNQLRGSDWRDRSSERPAPAPGAPAPGAVTPAPQTTAPGAGAGAPGAGGPTPTAPTAPAPGPPATQLAATPETASPATPSAGNTAAALAGLLAAQQPQQQPAAQQPQPQVAIPAPLLSPPQPQQRPAESPFRNGDETGLYDDPNMLLAALARGDFRPATATVAAPAVTAAVPATPEPVTYTPLNQLSPLAGIAPVNAVAAQPVMTGTSSTGLVTDNNVSGRADGAAPRTAMSTTHLAGASAANAVANPAAAQTVPGAGMGGAPVVGAPLGGMGGGGGTGKDREKVTASQTSDQFVLSGGPAIAEAVPGGTIARKDGS